MTDHDSMLDRIDTVLAGDGTAIVDDWTVSGDAMRSRPSTERDPEFGTQPPGRTTVQHVRIDLSAFRAAFEKFEAALLRGAERFAALMADKKFRTAALRAVVEQQRQQRDLAEIRAIARVELLIARAYLDRSVDAVYADLGLERTR